MGAGGSLRKIREEKGISIEEIHKLTKLHYNIINALEEDRLDNINPVYAKMFIKNYCKALEVDPKEFLNSFSLATKARKFSAPSPLLSKQESNTIKVPLKRKISPKFLIVIGAALAIFLVVYFVAYISAHRQTKKVSASYREKAIAEKVKLKQGQTKKYAASPKISPKDIAIVLGVRPKRNIWLKVRIDDKTVFRGNLTKQEFETWKAKGKIELWASDVGDIELELNGKILPHLGKRGRKIKHILITKKGLSIIE